MDWMENGGAAVMGAQRLACTAVAVLSAAAAVLSLAGCGGSTSPSQTGFKSFNSGEQLVFEDDAVGEVESIVVSFAGFNPYSPVGFARVAPRRASALIRILPGEINQRPRFQTTGCQPTVSGDTTDADGDGIPVSATSTFDCDTTFTGGSQSETGTVSFADPTPNTADVEYDSDVNLTITQHTSSVGDANYALKSQNAVAQSPGTLSGASNSTYESRSRTPRTTKTLP